MTKECRRCKEVKTLDCYSRQSGMKDGLRGYCKTCNSELTQIYQANYPEKVRDSYYRKMYGITAIQYDEMFESQGGLCVICKQPERAKSKSLAVDHRKSDRLVRGLLCHKCNAGLGHFDENIEFLKAAINYLINQKMETNMTEEKFGEADREPTPEEEKATENLEVDPEAADTIKEQYETSADVEGEGRIP